MIFSILMSASVHSNLLVYISYDYVLKNKISHFGVCLEKGHPVRQKLKEQRNCILCIICMWSLFCSVRICINLHFLSILLMKLGFVFLCFGFSCFSSLSLVFSFYFFCSIFWVQCYLKRLHNILQFCSHFIQTVC